MPKTNGLSPLELLTSSKYSRNGLVNFRVFGCPAYVLDPKLHNAGGFIPKFSPRSRRGVFLGMSAKHASTIPLILNLDTLAITSQYHVVFDDEFTTVTSNKEISTIDDIWLNLFNTERYKYEFDEDDDILEPEPWTDERAQILDRHLIQDEMRPDRTIPMVPETPNTQLKSEERLIADLSPSPGNIQLDTPLKFKNDSPPKLNLNKSETPLKTQSDNDSDLNITIQPSSPTPSPQKVQTPII